MIAYPTSIPLDAVTDTIRIVRGGTIQAEAKQLGLNIWNIQGYMQSVILGNPMAVINGEPPTEECKLACLELVSILEAESKSVTGAGDLAVVGSDLSVFLKNINLIGFVPALKQFILDIFNIK
jgi:hypothetical protein